MDHATVVKGLFLAVPLLLLGLKLIPGRWVTRLPAALVAGVVIGQVVAGVLPQGPLSYVASFTTMASIYAVLALGLNCQWGYTGHLNFGIAGFFAVGAFTTALVTTAEPTGVMANYTKQAFGLEMPFVIGLVAAAVVSGIAAFLIAIPVLRLRMDFLAIASIGIAEIIRLIFQNERWLANGPQPLRGIPQPLRCLFEEPACGPAFLQSILGPLQTRDYTFLYLVIVTLILALIYILLETATRSPWGRMLRAVRDEEASAGMNGKNVTGARIQSFVVGGVIMGLAGGLYAHYTVTIDYTHFRPLFATFIVWVMLMLGGSGNNKGAMLGAFIIWGVWSGTSFLTGAIEPALAAIHPDLPARSAYLRWLLVAILLGGIVLFRPQGLLPEEPVVSRYVTRRRER
jgi:branched-chain amino acid transport system permease protein